MTRAIIRNGAIVPLEPLPPDWADGTEVQVEAAGEPTPDEIDRAFDELERLCATGSGADHQHLLQALADADREAKAWMRCEMGLAE